MLIRAQISLLAALILFTAPAPASPEGMPPTELAGLRYDVPFFPGSSYDSSVPTPESILGFPAGETTATPAQIVECFQAWAKASPRARLVEYARSHEGRPLYYMILTSEENMARLDEIKAGMSRLADPRELSAEEGDRLVETLPPPAWLAYSIHGNESSGSDAAVALAYHLAASTDEAVKKLLSDLVILIDPSMNPDGRARFVKQKGEARGDYPNVDSQSMLHSGYWPGGRTNHYLFDLNRDWILGVHPETRGRVRAAGEWHPLLFVDAHEMGSMDTYLFSPPRDPVNPHFAESIRRWVQTFAREQAAAFDQMGWPFYTGEWNDGWYPGYSNAWAEYRGAVGFLYEQARTAEDGVRLPNGQIRPYRKSVHHQVVSSMANLKSLQTHAVKLKRRFLDERRKMVGPESPYGDRVFAVLPTMNRSRLNEFVDLMHLEGLEVYRTTESFTVSDAVDQLGRTVQRRRLPEGTILIPNRQPEGRLAAAMLEFDPRMPDISLTRERNELLKKGSSRMYDTTAWNLTMLHGLEALTLRTGMPEGAEKFVPDIGAPPPALPSGDLIVAYVIDGSDDRSVAAAARLMERGVKVRLADLPFFIDGHVQGRGTVVVTRDDNRNFEGNLAEMVRLASEELHLEVQALTTGLGEGDLPDLGGRHFNLLEPPRIALATRGRVHPYDYGTIWHVIDKRIGIRHSHIEEDALNYTDLRRYNVLVLPDRFFGGGLDESAYASLKSWVEAGGTLIAVGDTAGLIAKEEPGLSGARQLPDVLGDLDKYRLDLQREWMASMKKFPAPEEVWSHAAAPDLSFPWDWDDEAMPGEEEMERRDAWQRIFMPQGAIVAARVDAEHWLSFGSGTYLPILYAEFPVLMAEGGVEAPIRMGVYTESGSPPAGEDEDVKPVGWAPNPPGHDLIMRMSGLLWPEAANRLANAAWVTRERKGDGQIILFATPPAFRGATMGTIRVLMNALVYGPGMGADHPVVP